MNIILIAQTALLDEIINEEKHKIMKRLIRRHDKDKLNRIENKGPDFIRAKCESLINIMYSKQKLKYIINYPENYRFKVKFYDIDRKKEIDFEDNIIKYLNAMKTTDDKSYYEAKFYTLLGNNQELCGPYRQIAIIAMVELGLGHDAQIILSDLNPCIGSGHYVYISKLDKKITIKAFNTYLQSLNSLDFTNEKIMQLNFWYKKTKVQSCTEGILQMNKSCN